MSDFVYYWKKNFVNFTDQLALLKCDVYEVTAGWAYG